MKKIISLLIALTLMIALACPAFADVEPNSAYIGSIKYEEDDEIDFVTVEGGEGSAVAVIRDAEGNVVAYVPAACLQIITLGSALNEEKDVPQEIREQLLAMQEALGCGDIVLPYEKHDTDKTLVLSNLFDVRFTCEDHPETLAQEGYTLEITFALDVDKDAVVHTMVYDEETEEWEPIVSTVNNGDGTITCVFTKLCIVEFSVEQ